MKKIVALVLCLALALSLCTVAFAATGELTQINTAQEWAVTVSVKEAKAPVYKDDDVKTAGNIAYYEVTVTGNGSVQYYVAADTDATHTLKYSGNTVRVKAVNTVEDLKYGYVATKITDINNDTCGSMEDATEALTFVTYVDAKNVTNLATATAASGTTDGKTNVLLNGAVKSVTATTSYTKHVWELVDADDDGKFDSGEIVKCDECGATSKVYSANTAAVTGTIFEALGASATPATGYAAATYTWMGGSAASTGSSSTVESAKTFDAGIALYAGMALASVAGSAVVIGKKKEF